MRALDVSGVPVKDQINYLYGIKIGGGAGGGLRLQKLLKRYARVHASVVTGVVLELYFPPETDENKGVKMQRTRPWLAAHRASLLLALCGKPDRGPSAALSAQLRCLPVAGTGLPGDVDWVSGVRIAWIARKKQAHLDLFFSYAPEAI